MIWERIYGNFYRKPIISFRQFGNLAGHTWAIKLNSLGHTWRHSWGNKLLGAHLGHKIEFPGAHLGAQLGQQITWGTKLNFLGHKIEFPGAHLRHTWGTLGAQSLPQGILISCSIGSGTTTKQILSLRCRMILTWATPIFFTNFQQVKFSKSSI